MRKIYFIAVGLLFTWHSAYAQNFELIKLERSLALPNVASSSGYQTDLNLRSSIALIYDRDANRVVYSKNPDQPVPIASITKLMIAMVVLDARLPLHQRLSIEQDDVDKIKGTHSRLAVGTVLTRGELLRLALMSSENRAAAALARTFPGGTRMAIRAINNKAEELGMFSSHFVESTGLSSQNVSTANDLVAMVDAASRYHLIHEYTTTESHSVFSENGREIKFNNTNPLVRSEEWQIGVSKTGFINEAGRCLVMEATINQRHMILVLLDSNGKLTRIGDANRVKDWVDKKVVQRF